MNGYNISMSVITIPKHLREKLGDNELATKADLLQVKTELVGEIKILKWMLGILLSGVISLVMKTFFR